MNSKSSRLRARARAATTALEHLCSATPAADAVDWAIGAGLVAPSFRAETSSDSGSVKLAQAAAFAVPSVGAASGASGYKTSALPALSPPPPPPPPEASSLLDPYEIAEEVLEAADAAAEWSSVVIPPSREGASATDPRCVCPPASLARIVLSHDGTLEGIDFSIALPALRRRSALPPNLIACLAQTSAGLALLSEARVPKYLLRRAFSRPCVNALLRRAAMYDIAALASSPGGLALLQRADPRVLHRLDAAARGCVYRARAAATPDASDDVSARMAARAALAAAGYHCGKVAEFGWHCARGVVCVAGDTARANTLLPGLTPGGALAAGGVDAAVIAAAAAGREALAAVEGAAGAEAGRGETAAATNGPSAAASGARSHAPYLSVAARVRDSTDAAVAAAATAVLAAIIDLASRICQRDARAALLKLKADKPDVFASPLLLVRAHALMARYVYALPVRRFIHGLFEQRVSASDRAWAPVEALRAKTV
jgi:hypothetical protein